MIIIVTNVLCYHQVYVADDLYEKFGDSFFYIQMREPLEWRVKQKQEGFTRPYLVSFKNNKSQAIKLIKNTDVLIYGEAPLKLIRKKKRSCLLFRMSENIFKDTQFSLTLFQKIKRFFAYKYLKYLTNNDHSYLLACGGFAYNDYYKLGIFRKRALKWGYFPYLPNISIEEICAKFSSNTIEIAWVSRLVEYKKPLYLLTLVKYLVSKGFDSFHLTIIGDSAESKIDYLKYLESEFRKNNLSRFVTFTGSISSESIFEYYKKVHIALFTADKSEGWSVGVNEAMSCGCAIVCSNGIGSVPFLINRKNGIVYDYSNVDVLCKSVEELLNNKYKIKEYCIEGFNTINEIWNHKNASLKLYELIKNYLETGKIVPFDYGPCSLATVLDYDFYKGR